MGFQFTRRRTYSSRDESVRSTSVRNNDKGIRGVGGVADKEAYTVHIISQRQCFVARRLSSFDGAVFGLHNMYMHLFSFYPQASDVDKTHSLVPAIVHQSIYLDIHSGD
jgi:hypothetical protein